MVFFQKNVCSFILYVDYNILSTVTSFPQGMQLFSSCSEFLYSVVERSRNDRFLTNSGTLRRGSVHRFDSAQCPNLTYSEQILFNPVSDKSVLCQNQSGISINPISAPKIIPDQGLEVIAQPMPPGEAHFPR